MQMGIYFGGFLVIWQHKFTQSNTTILKYEGKMIHGIIIFLCIKKSKKYGVFI